MDGRPHPSKYAEHTRGGFTTGRWDGDTLVTETTHMKAGLLRKNGPPMSDQATMTSRFWRHGDILTILAVVDDPIYLAEPHIVTKSFELSDDADAAGRPAVRDDVRGQAARATGPAFRAGKEPLRRRADEVVSPSGGGRPGRSRNAVSRVPEEDQGDVRAARAVQDGLRRPAGAIDTTYNAEIAEIAENLVFKRLRYSAISAISAFNVVALLPARDRLALR